MWTQPRSKPTRGAALLTATVLALITSIGGISLLTLMLSHIRLGESPSKRLIARYAAEAGYQYAFANLWTNPIWRPPAGKITLDGISHNGTLIPLQIVVTEPGPGIKKIQVTAEVPQ